MLGSFVSGCTLERMRQGSAQALGTARLAPQLSVVRSTRWRIDDPGYLTLVAEYDPNDAQHVAYLNAAFLGINRVYPRTALDPVPAVAGAPPALSVTPAALLIHVHIPPAGFRSRGSDEAVPGLCRAVAAEPVARYETDE